MTVEAYFCTEGIRCNGEEYSYIYTEPVDSLSSVYPVVDLVFGEFLTHQYIDRDSMKCYKDIYVLKSLYGLRKDRYYWKAKYWLNYYGDKLESILTEPGVATEKQERAAKILYSAWEELK